MGKYDKYFITEPKPGDDRHVDTELVKFPIYVDSEVIAGASYFMAASHLGTTGRGAPPFEHTHDFDEYLVFLGTNQKDPRDLGAEVEFWIDGEKHVITKSFAAFIPAGLEHCPLVIKNIVRPVISMAAGPCALYE